METVTWRDERASHPQARHSPRQERGNGNQSAPAKKKPKKKKKKPKQGTGGNQSGFSSTPPPNIPGGAQITVSQARIGTSQPQVEAGTGSPS